MIGQQIFNGLTLGMCYALLAVGYSLVFGILRLVNFRMAAFMRSVRMQRFCLSA